MKKKLLAAAVVLLAALTMSVIAGCSCSAQSSSSASGSMSASDISGSGSSSSSSGQVEVPNLVSLEVKDAERLLTEAGLEEGDVSEEYSDTVSAGLIISQDPKALTKVDKGSKVAFVVSKGKEAPEQVTVPNLIGMTQTEAEDAISDAGLIAVQDEPVVDPDVQPGLVCQQSIEAGTVVDEGTQIAIATALGSDEVEVPNLVGEPYEGAIDALQNLGLGYDKTTAYSDDFDEGLVMDQSVDFGESVTKGTIITLSVSLGPKPSGPVTVPDVYTYHLEDAKATLEASGFVCRYTGDEDGTVIAMDPEPETELEAGSEVTIQLQSVITAVKVPDIVGKTGDQALRICQDHLLDLIYDSSQGDQPLTGQKPAAGAIVEPESVVTGYFNPVDDDSDDDNS